MTAYICCNCAVAVAPGELVCGDRSYQNVWKCNHCRTWNNLDTNPVWTPVPTAWTREKPTKPGWYWLRWIHKRTPREATVEIVNVTDRYGDLSVVSSGQEESDSVSFIHENCHALWAGPLVPPPMPEEPLRQSPASGKVKP